MPATSPALTGFYNVPLDEIQGNITPGFKRDFQDFVFLRFPENTNLVRSWLHDLKPAITTANTVATSRNEYRALWNRYRAADATEADIQAYDQFVEEQPVWINVAFTYVGLELLEPTDLDLLPTVFKSGFLGELARLKIRRDDMGGWRVRDGFNVLEELHDSQRRLELRERHIAHAVLIIGANTDPQLDAARQTQINLATSYQLTRLDTFHGVSQQNGRDHLGFADPVSQPDPPDLLAGWPRDGGEQIVAPGEFIVGCDREPGHPWPDPEPPAFAQHGSYMVLIRINQELDRIRNAVAAEAERLQTVGVSPMNTEMLMAKVIGRWHSGATLSEPTGPADLTASADPVAMGDATPPPLITAADFANDTEGYGCPAFAHIRRAFPRTRDDARYHRIVRRGITYNDETGQGILFVAYQASIKEGFEHIQRFWLASTGKIEVDVANVARFLPRIVRGPLLRFSRKVRDIKQRLVNRPNSLLRFLAAKPGDLLNALPEERVGNLRQSRYYYQHPTTGHADIDIPIHTTVTSGGYFFAPSIGGIGALAGEIAP